MARPIDEPRNVRQRTLILTAAYRRFATLGFERTSTAAICEAAEVSSGTLFHYFPTKLDILLALLASNTRSTEASLDRHSASGHGLSAVLGLIEESERRMTAGHFGGFVRAANGAAHHPEVADALRADSERLNAFLRTHLRIAADERRIRIDVRADQLATWVQWLLDGATHEAAEQEHVVGGLERATIAMLQS